MDIGTITGIVGVILGVSGVAIAIVIDKRTKRLHDRYWEPVCNQLNSIAEKLGIDNRLIVTANGNTRLIKVDTDINQTSSVKFSLEKTRRPPPSTMTEELQ